jgi:hypothetical protein
MSTRCRIEIRDGKYTYRIYRHSDGYPQGVIADLYIFMNNYSRNPGEDPEYFLANFIFYAKLAEWIRVLRENDKSIFDYKWWEYGYGVCAPNCDHGDLDYAYTIEGQNVEIKKYDWEIRGWRLIFSGTIEEAYKKFCANTPYADGCHIAESIFATQKLLETI